METTFTGADSRVWLYAGNPDSDVRTSGGTRAEFGALFMNTTNQKLFFCYQEGTNNQLWAQYAYISQVQALVGTRSQSSASRSLNSAFQPSSTRDCLVNYSVDITTSITLTTGQSGTVFLEIASDSGFTTNVQELGRFLNGNTGTLTLGLSLTQSVTGTLSGYVPAGYYARLRTVNNTSTPTFTYRSGQEVLL